MLGASVTINKKALLNNVSVLKACADNRPMVWMVKSNAYGHGADVIAPLLPQDDALGVACFSEACQLIEKGIAPSRILLMRGALDQDECDQMCRTGIQLVLHSSYQMPLLRAALAKGLHPSSVWLHVDTGMSRLGVSSAEFKAIYAALQEMLTGLCSVNVMTHLACADNFGSDSVASQLEVFSSLPIQEGSLTAVLNSAGMLYYPDYDSHYVRPGIALYGISPLHESHPTMNELIPVMSFTAPIIDIKSIQKGATVGYGGTWTASRNSHIAICAVGYGDGYPREISGAFVWCRGYRFPVIGRVSMDFIAIDVTGNEKDLTIGERVELWGEQLRAEELAEAACTIPYTLFTRVSGRVIREVTEG